MCGWKSAASVDDGRDGNGWKHVSGPEDNLYVGPGGLAQRSAGQVTRVASIANQLGVEIANPDEARSMLNLKGRNQTGWATAAAK